MRKPRGIYADPLTAAAQWLATTPDDRKPHPLMPHLRKEYGLTTAEAIDAIQQANLIRARAT